MDEGFKKAGFETRLAYDSEQHCVDTHRKNHERAGALRSDLSDTSHSDIVKEWQTRSPQASPIGLIGGPPCQAFSFANVHKKDEDDERAHLVDHYATFIAGLHKEFDLGFFVFENVTGLLSERHIHFLKRFEQDVDAAGFEVTRGTLNALHFGVPQHRERVFVIGINRRRYPGVKFKLPKGDEKLKTPVKTVLKGLPPATYFSRRLRPEDIGHHENHWCMRPRSKKFGNGSIIPGDSSSSRSFRALDWERFSYTVAYGNREVHVHPDCKRRLSVHESMLLQGFESKYVLKGNLSQQFSMVSDAVAPPVAAALARALDEQLALGSGLDQASNELITGLALAS